MVTVIQKTLFIIISPSPNRPAGRQAGRQADEQRAAIERTAQAILDARALYPESSLADLYDVNTMPKELREAHRANDRAVMKAYKMPTKTSEAEAVAHLMERYKTLTKKK